jgi:hypothetical protein
METKRLEVPRPRGQAMTWGRMIWFEITRGHSLALKIL